MKKAALQYQMLTRNSNSACPLFQNCPIAKYGSTRLLLCKFPLFSDQRVPRWLKTLWHFPILLLYWLLVSRWQEKIRRRMGMWIICTTVSYGFYHWIFTVNLPYGTIINPYIESVWYYNQFDRIKNSIYT